jgi:hypothetical protein
MSNEPRRGGMSQNMLKPDEFWVAVSFISLWVCFKKFGKVFLEECYSVLRPWFMESHPSWALNPGPGVLQRAVHWCGLEWLYEGVRAEGWREQDWAEGWREQGENPNIPQVSSCLGEKHLSFQSSVEPPKVSRELMPFLTCYVHLVQT